MSWFLLNRNLTLLEPYDWKLSCTVLRGERGSNAPDLPGNNMGKSVEFDEKAREHERIAQYWANKADTINLSMPESVDYYEHKLAAAKEYHEGLKSGKYPREHSYSLTYAKKAVNEAQKNFDLAKKLWL